MVELKTKDGHKVKLTFSNINPSYTRGGMAPATTYLWFNFGNGWMQAKTIHAHALRNIIETSTLLELKNKETIL